jgi:hypothetical protein
MAVLASAISCLCVCVPPANSTFLSAARVFSVLPRSYLFINDDFPFSDVPNIAAKILVFHCTGSFRNVSYYLYSQDNVGLGSETLWFLN